MTSNLYVVALPETGNEDLPVAAGLGCARIGCTRPSHALKLPTTLTRRAFGAHTAKCTPVRMPCVIDDCAPSLLNASKCVPSPSRCRSKSVSTGP